MNNGKIAKCKRTISTTKVREKWCTKRGLPRTVGEALDRLEVDPRRTTSKVRTASERMIFGLTRTDINKLDYYNRMRVDQYLKGVKKEIQTMKRALKKAE